MPPRLLEPLVAPVDESATTILAVPIGGNGAFPLGIAKTFGQQFSGNKRCCRVLSLTELLYAAASEARLSVYFLAVPEWRLFLDGQGVLDTPETTFNFMLYYIMIVVFPSEDSEIVFKGIVAKLMADNASLTAPATSTAAPLDGEEADADRTRSAPKMMRGVGPIETPRVKIFRGGAPPDVATQLSIVDMHSLTDAVLATGVPAAAHLPESDTLADDIWILLTNHLQLDRVLQNLQVIDGLVYPPWLGQLSTTAVFYVPAEIIKFQLVSKVPHTTGKDQLALFILPGIVNPTRIAEADDFDVPMIGESRDAVFVASETRGFSFKDPSKLLAPLPAICSRIFRRLLSLAKTPSEWSHVYRYCHKYMRMLFANPYVAGFPSIYRDLFTEIDRLRVKAATDPLMQQFYAPRAMPGAMGVLHHQISLVISLLHSAGLRDNHVVVALAYLSASGSCRIFGGDSDITAFTGTAGKGKSNILNMISALVNEVSQYSMDAASARAITMPQNPITVAGRVVGEAPQNGRITFTDDGAGAFQPGKGSHADKDGDAMKLTQASRGCITYQVINPHEDERGNKVNKVQTRVVACKSSRFMAMNGNAGSDAGASRMQCFYVKSSAVAPAQSASAVCALDVSGVPDELESMYAANQLRNAEVSYYNAMVAFGLATEATVSLWQVFIIRALESPAAREYTQELKILQSPRKIGAVVRNSLCLASNKLFHLLETGGFAKAFIGNNTLKRMMWMQQANYVSPELITLALSSALPVCNGASNVEHDIYRQIKDQVDFEVMAPFTPRTVRKGGKSYYVLNCPTVAVLQQIIRDHMPEYEAVDVVSKLGDICKATIPHSKQQYLEKDGERLIFYAKPLDMVFAATERNVLNIMQTQLSLFRTDHPTLLHDCFPHDLTDEYILIPHDQCYLFSRHANNPAINELGNEFEMGVSLLQYNTVYGRALAPNTTQSVHPRDIPQQGELLNHFPGRATLVNCTAINLKALAAGDADLSTGFLRFVPCFRDEICMIATGKASAPNVPETVGLKALTEPFVITNPHFCEAHVRMLPTLETSVVEKEFFGSDYSHIEIPPGPITELYLLYTRVFVLNKQVPLTISRPDFIAHFLKYGVSSEHPYTPYLPEPCANSNGLNAQTASVYMLFKNLATKMRAAGLDDDILRHLAPDESSRKRKSNTPPDE